MRVFISGYFGFGNLGDEAILEAVVLELRRRHPDAAIAATFGSEKSSAARLQLEVVDFFDLDGIATSVARAHLVLFGLGGVFMDYWGAASAALFREGSAGIEAYARPALLARMERVPAALFCGGVGPLRTPAGRAMVRMASEAADLLLVRDGSSAREILDIAPRAKPVVAVDPAHLLAATGDDRRRAAASLQAAGIGGGAVAVAAREWDFDIEREALVARLARALATLPPDVPLVFLPFHCGAGTDDRAFAEAIRAALPGRTSAVIHPRTGGEAIALFEQSSLVVAVRNHAVVFAGCAGTPVVSLRYDPKVGGSASLLGVEDLMLGIPELDRLPETMARALAAREAIAARMAAHRATVLSRLQGAYDLLDGLVASPLGTESPSPEADDHLRRLESLEQELVRVRSELRSIRVTLRDH